MMCRVALRHPRDARDKDDQQEVQVGDDLVRGHGCGQLTGLLHAGCLGDRGEIQPATDVGAGKDPGEFRFVRAEIEQGHANDRAGDNRRTAENECDQRWSRFAYDPLEIRVEQQQRDRDGHQVIPDGVVYGCRGRNDAQVRKDD